MILPNKTSGANRMGWGIMQINKEENGASKAEVYDWYENVVPMNVPFSTSPKGAAVHRRGQA